MRFTACVVFLLLGIVACTASEPRVKGEERRITLPLSGSITLNIIRATGPDGNPGVMDLLAAAARDVEEYMAAPYPSRINPVVQVSFVPKEALDGVICQTNSAVGWIEVDDALDNPDSRNLHECLVHEIAHYYWAGHPVWLDEGAATFLQYYIVWDGRIPSPEVVADCSGYSAISELEQSNLEIGDTDYGCYYFWGYQLFQELYHSLDEAEFQKRFRELYGLLGGPRRFGSSGGIVEVRQAFPGPIAQQVINRLY